jgi:DEAD/DEAH box helicase domain-containing protein
VRHIDCDYYTDAITNSRVTPLDTAAAAGDRPRALSAHGDVHVVSRVVGFKKIKFYTNENVGSGELDLPERQMHTTAYWLTVPRELMTALPFGSDDRRDGVVGMSHAMRQVAQLLLMCDARDIGVSIGPAREATEDGQPHASAGPASSWSPTLQDGDEPRVFIYDNYPGGIGLSEPLYRLHEKLLTESRALIEACPCADGCPSCVGPSGEVGARGKDVALAILRAIVSE